MLFEHGAQRNFLLSAHIPFPRISHTSTLVYENDFSFLLLYTFSRCGATEQSNTDKAFTHMENIFSVFSNIA